MVNLAMDAPKSGKIIPETPDLCKNQPSKPYYLKMKNKKYETVPKNRQQMVQESEELKRSLIIGIYINICIGHIHEKVLKIVNEY
jgi:hypothetical protein